MVFTVVLFVSLIYQPINLLITLGTYHFILPEKGGGDCNICVCVVGGGGGITIFFAVLKGGSHFSLY